MDETTVLDEKTEEEVPQEEKADIPSIISPSAARAAIKRAAAGRCCSSHCA